mgnify:CR=1 FL=1
MALKRPHKAKLINFTPSAHEELTKYADEMHGGNFHAALHSVICAQIPAAAKEIAHVQDDEQAGKSDGAELAGE